MPDDPTMDDADILALDGGHEWRDVVRELQRMGKWPNFEPADQAAAVAALTKREAEEAAKAR